MSARRSVLVVVVSLCALVGVLVLGGSVAWAAGVPVVSEESVSFGIGSATVSAQVDPEGFATTYVVEYGPGIPYESKTVAVNVGSGEGPVEVSPALTGLKPNTLYDYRVVAVSEAGSTDGSDATFTTYPVATGLPDGRVYEMVTPPENHDADVYVPTPGSTGMTETEYPFQASENGDAITYAADPTTGGNGNSGTDEGNQYLAARSSQGGWNQVNIDPLGDETVSYQAFSSDLSIGIFASFHTTPGEYNVLYARTSAEGGITPVFNATPSYRVGGPFELGKKLDRFATIHTGPGFEHVVLFAGASEGFSDMLFEANDDLLNGKEPLEEELNGYVKTEVDQIRPLEEEYAKLSYEISDLRNEGYGEGAPILQAKEAEGEAKYSEIRAVEDLDDRNELYVSTDGHLSLVNVSPEGKVVPGATFGGPAQVNDNREPPGFSHVISADGSRIFWSSVEDTGEFGISVQVQVPKAIYVREGGARTVQVSAGPAEFWAASADGRYAFYTEAGKLWRFDVESETRVELAGSTGGVQGVVAVNETGEDGAYVYFVAHEALSGLENGAKQVPVEGGENLYVEEPDPEHAGQSRTVFIGTLSSSDANDWALGVGRREAEATPDGEALVFMSSENLTGGAYADEGAEEVYVFHAQDGGVVCASCRAQGSGGSLPTATSYVRQPRWISEDGDRVFFDSEAPLVWSDINAAMDVYEWEADGSGECDETTGCVYLISGGREAPAKLIDASASGNDVFFATRQRLSALDDNENIDLYDARVDGVEAVSPPVCSGTACQGVPSPPPVFATPASVTFEGVGDFPPPASPVVAKTKSLTRAQKLSRALDACREKHRKKERDVCEAKARKLYGAKTKAKAKKSTTTGVK